MKKHNHLLRITQGKAQCARCHNDHIKAVAITTSITLNSEFNLHKKTLLWR